MQLYAFFLFLFFSCTAFANHPLAICAIFKDEAKWFREWIEFHEMQGVTHFYLYNNNSQDHYLAVLKPYIDSGKVTLIDWTHTYDSNQADKWIQIQTGAYMDCIHKFKKDADWIAFIDVDEFLYCVNGTPLPQSLKNYTSYGGLCVNWRLFGTSNIEDIPPNNLMIETLLSCSPVDISRNSLVKSIVQPRYVRSCHSAHYFKYKSGKYDVNEHFKRWPRKGEVSAVGISHDVFCINHYWTRTESHFRHHKMGSRNFRRKGETFKRLREMANQYNKMRDTKILQFVPELRKRMGFN